jgi:hypothetical protein
VLAYSTYLGGSGPDYGSQIAVDGSGNAYVTGTTASTNFPVTPGAYQTFFNGVGKSSANVFVSKLNPAGTGLEYSTYIGGTGGDEGIGIAVDAEGDAYVTGESLSSDFPTTPGAFQTVNEGVPANESNGFVTKLNPSGSALLYSTFLGGSFSTSVPDEGDIVDFIVVDAAGNAYLGGTAFSSDFPVTRGAFQTKNPSTFATLPESGFVTKLNATGSALIYSTYLGGSGYSGIGGLAIDGAGRAFVAGFTSSTDFPITAGAFQSEIKTPAGNSTAFVTELNRTGTGLVYSTYLGGTLEDYAEGIALDRSGNAYVTGASYSSDFPVTPGAFQTVNKAASKTLWNAFVTKINPYGTALVYSTYLGGSGNAAGLGYLGVFGGDTGDAIAIDTRGDAYIAGWASSGDFPLTADALQSVNNAFGEASRNAFVTKIDATGTALLYSSYLGGGGGVMPFGVLPGNGDAAAGLAIDSTGAAYISGSAAADFPTTVGAFQATRPIQTGANQGTGFVAKLDIGDATITPVITVTPSPSTVPRVDWLTVTVTVIGGANSPTPTGRVRLTSGSYTSANLVLSGSSTAFYFPAKKLAIGLDTLTVSYTPDSASSTIYPTASGTGTVTVD